MGCEGTRRLKGRGGRYPNKTVYSVSGISKGHYRKGCAGSPPGMALASRSPAVLRPFSRSRRAVPEPPRQGKSQCIAPGLGNPTRAMLPQKKSKNKNALTGSGIPTVSASPLLLLPHFRYGKRFEGLGHFVLNDEGVYQLDNGFLLINIELFQLPEPFQ